ncbi:unnamed protein product [Ilex paraguariensis]|uniref:MADS-box domain-containing protein n=1 Tax=Ilex paraguariensis TaxID=185542 RepID=A0ABC8RG12_9AQUA
MGTSVKRFMFKKAKGTKRLEGLSKKIKELSILCDIDAFLVCYDGDDTSSSSCCYTWPEDPKACLSLIQKYKKNLATIKHCNGCSSRSSKKAQECERLNVGLQKKVQDSEEFKIDLRKKLKESEESHVGSSKKAEKGEEHNTIYGATTIDFVNIGMGVGVDERQELLSRIDQVKLDVEERIRFLTMTNQNKVINREEETLVLQDMKKQENQGEKKGPNQDWMMGTRSYSGMLNSIILENDALDANLASLHGHDDLMESRGCMMGFDSFSGLLDSIVLQGCAPDANLTSFHGHRGLMESNNSMMGCDNYCGFLDSTVLEGCVGLGPIDDDRMMSCFYGHGGFMYRNEWMMGCDRYSGC